MTREECKKELERLGRGWNVALSKEQLDALYSRIQQVSVRDWETAVDTLLAEFIQAPRTGFLDHALKAVDGARLARQQAAAHKEKVEASRFFTGKIPLLKYADPQEQAYNNFRMALLIQCAGHPQKGQTAKVHADALDAYLKDDANVTWASKQPMGDCGFHGERTSLTKHTLLACLVDEQRYWTLRAAGKSELEAKTEIAAVMA